MSKTLKQVQAETSKHFTRAIRSGGLAELHAIDKKLDKHYNAGTLALHDYRRLTVRLMEEMVRHELESN